jgi:uncharacterized GH25 family protein
MAAIEHTYRQGEMDKGVAMAEMMTLQDNQSQDFYGKVIDQYGHPVTEANVSAEINLTFGRGGTQKTQTDANGLFQFTGLRGRSLRVGEFNDKKNAPKPDRESDSSIVARGKTPVWKRVKGRTG